MLNSPWISVPVGLVLGVLTGLGTGGGSLLLLWLTLVLHMDPAQARLVNLMFFLPSALAALWAGRRQVPFRKVLLPVVTGCSTAALFALWAKNMDTEPLKKLFGVLLLILGTRELLYQPRKPR